MPNLLQLVEEKHKLALDLDAFPELSKLELAIKADDVYYAWDGTTRGEVLTSTPKSLGKGAFAQMPDSEAAEYAGTLEIIKHIKAAVMLPVRLYNAKKARALVFSTLRSALNKVTEARGEAIKTYLKPDQEEEAKIVAANVAGTKRGIAVDRPTMF